MTPEDHPHLTPDLPAAAEAPDLPGAMRPHPEDSPVGRRAMLPMPYGGSNGIPDREGERDAPDGKNPRDS
jgi:hypothetical protein